MSTPRIKNKPACDFCQRPIADAYSNNRRYHAGCEQLLIARTRDPVVRRRLMEARRRRMRKDGVPPLKPETKPRKKAEPLTRAWFDRPVVASANAGSVAASGPPCDFCARVHGNGREQAECLQRANRAAADVRGWR